MERSAHYITVAVVSILLFAVLAGFIFWLAGAQFSRRYDVYEIDFKGPIRGLSTGGEVFFNGIRVGEVTKLSLDRIDPSKVKARIRIDSDSPVRTDSHAGLEPQGLTGVNYIQISAGTARARLLKDVTPEGHTPVIIATPSALESLLQGGGDVLTRTVDVLDRATRLLSDDNIASVTGTLRDVHAVTTELKGQKQLFTNLDATVISVNRTSERVGELAASSSRLVDGDGRRALTNLADAAAELKGAAVDTRAMIAGLKGPVGDVATQGLPQLNRTVTSLRNAADNLSRLTTEIELNPAGLISKAPAARMEVKP